MCEYYPAGNVIGEFDTQVQSQTKGTSGAVRSGDGLRGTTMAVALSVIVVRMLTL